MSDTAGTLVREIKRYLALVEELAPSWRSEEEEVGSLPLLEEFLLTGPEEEAPKVGELCDS